jgi:hypothetical protein
LSLDEGRGNKRIIDERNEEEEEEEGGQVNLKSS